MAASYEEGSAFKRPLPKSEEEKPVEKPEPPPEEKDDREEPSIHSTKDDDFVLPKDLGREKYRWGPKPSFRDQMTKAGAYRLGEVKVETFNMSDPSQAAALNNLMSRSLPLEAPQIMITDKERNFSESAGGYVVYVEYFTVEYMQLHPTPAHAS